MDWKNLFLSPNGRIGQKEFWIGWVILFAIAIVINYLPADLKMIGSVISLILIYPNVCVFSKRLHDAGRSGWLAALPYVVGILGGVLIAITGGAAIMAALSGGGDPAAAMAGAGIALLILLGLVVFYFGFVLWTGLAKSDPATNQYGPPPSDAAPAA